MRRMGAYSMMRLPCEMEMRVRVDKAPQDPGEEDGEEDKEEGGARDAAPGKLWNGPDVKVGYVPIATQPLMTVTTEISRSRSRYMVLKPVRLAGGEVEARRLRAARGRRRPRRRGEPPFGGAPWGRAPLIRRQTHRGGGAGEGSACSCPRRREGGVGEGTAERAEATCSAGCGAPAGSADPGVPRGRDHDGEVEGREGGRYGGDGQPPASGR